MLVWWEWWEWQIWKRVGYLLRPESGNLFLRCSRHGRWWKLMSSVMCVCSDLTPVGTLRCRIIPHPKSPPLTPASAERTPPPPCQGCLCSKSFDDIPPGNISPSSHLSPPPPAITKLLQLALRCRRRRAQPNKVKENHPIHFSCRAQPPAMPPPALKLPPAPSQKLLRFLRAQSEGLAFFTGSPECAAPLRRPAALPRAARSHHGRLTPRPRRPLSTSPPARNLAVLQAGLIDVESILPRVLLRRSRTSAAAESKGNKGLVPLAAGTTRSASSGSQSPRDDCAEEECRPRWRDWLFGPSQKRRQQLKEDDLRLQMEEESGSIFQRRSLASKAALDPRLRCTEVAGNGEVIMVDGELKKSELIAKVGGRRG